MIHPLMMNDVSGALVMVSGPCGVGKSTLAQALADQLGWRCALESAGETNPFLAAYYQQPQRWAFHSQAFFLAEAFAQQSRLAHEPGNLIQDRHLHEHLAMFAQPKWEAGEMTNEEYRLLERLVNTAVSAVGAPNLLVYAHAPAEIILERVRARARDYEQGFTLERGRNELLRYEEFIAGWALSPVLRVDTTQHDVRSPAGRSAVAALVREAVSDGV